MIYSFHVVNSFVMKCNDPGNRGNSTVWGQFKISRGSGDDFKVIVRMIGVIARIGRN